MANYTDEDRRRCWIKAMAEADGYRDVHFQGDYLFGRRPLGSFADHCVVLLSPVVGGGRCDYEHDLNAQARVARKICETDKGRYYLSDLLTEAFRDSEVKLRKSIIIYGYQSSWQSCLTTEELFPIYGRVLDKLGVEKE